MPSPIPKPDARRQRHEIKAAQSSQRLPVTGRVGRPPSCPVALGEAGTRWWRWAWTTPQATAWNKGYMEPLARRASLEDDYAKLDLPADRARLLATMVRLDESFGLTPKAAAMQHLVFTDDEPQPLKSVTDAPVTPMRPRLKGMRD